MSMFWKRGDELERELRRQRPEPSTEFLRAVESRIHGDRYRRPVRSLRLGLAGALTVAMLASLAVFGGLGTAATGVSHAVMGVVHVVAPTRDARPSNAISSARAQYKVQMCFHGHTISVDSHATGALSAAGAKPGPCRAGAFVPPGQRAWMCFRGHNVQVRKTEVKAMLKFGLTRGFCKVKK
jgi:hypothetical protein